MDERIVEALYDRTFSEDELIKRLVSQYPNIFLELITQESPLKAYPWIRELHDFATKGQKVSYIKLLREHTGVGLKEAKDFADHIFWHYANAGFPCGSTQFLIDTDAYICEDLRKYIRPALYLLKINP